MALLGPSGTAYVVVPSWTLARQRTGVPSPNVRLREHLLIEDAVAGIVQLPRRIHPFRTGAELALLVLRRDAGPAERGLTRLVDGDRIALRTGLGQHWAECVTDALTTADLPASEEVRDIPVTAASPRGEQLLDGRSLLPAHRLASPSRDSTTSGHPWTPAGRRRRRCPPCGSGSAAWASPSGRARCRTAGSTSTCGPGS